MKAVPVRATLPVMILLVLVIVCAGCTSIPGPESGKKTTAPTPAVTTPATVQPEVILEKTPKIVPSGIVTSIPVETVPIQVLTMVPTTGAIPPAGNSTSTCMEQGGTTVIPGYDCGGSWIGASDTFSCCYGKIVPVSTDAGIPEIAPFGLEIDLSDSPGNAIP